MRTFSLTALSTLVLAAGLATSTAANAESGLYLGGSLGNAQVGLKDTGDTLHLDGNDIGYKLFAGFKFTFAAVEAGYVDFGAIEKDSSSVEINGFNAFGKLSFGLGPVEVFGKVGGFVWNSDFELAEEKYKEDGFDPVVGIGAAFDLGGLGVRAEYEYYDIKEFDKVSMISVGATWWLL